MNFTILIVCCLWSKIAYLLASREKNNENIERTLKTSVCAYYTGIFYLINIIVGSEKVERTEHVKNFWNVIVIVVDFFITLPFSTIEGKVIKKVNHYDYDVSKFLNKTPPEFKRERGFINQLYIELGLMQGLWLLLAFQ